MPPARHSVLVEKAAFWKDAPSTLLAPVKSTDRKNKSPFCASPSRVPPSAPRQRHLLCTPLQTPPARRRSPPERPVARRHAALLKCRV